MDLVLYIHGKGGSADEAEHYKPLFSQSEVVGLDYRTFSPAETGEEIREAIKELKPGHERLTIIANSIGAFFSMCAGIGGMIDRAYFISPVVDMERLILDMITCSGTSEEELKNRGVIPTGFGEDLSWDYLCYVRDHPVVWNAPTSILYGSLDTLTSYETVRGFAKEHGASLTVMEGGEHWFHTAEQMSFLDDWIKAELKRDKLVQ